MTYIDKLKDPRWQKKRLKILKRDEFTCQQCYDTSNTLVIHHLIYLIDKEPWEYPDKLLITLCESCHEVERKQRKQLEQQLLEQIQTKFLSPALLSLIEGFHNLQLPHTSDVTSSVIEWVLSSPYIMQELTNRYFCFLKYKPRGNGTKKELIQFIKENKIPKTFISDIKKIFIYLDKLRGYKATKRNTEATSIIRMRKKGFTPEQIIDTWKTLKVDSFWVNRELFLMTVETQIGARINSAKINNKINQEKAL